MNTLLSAMFLKMKQNKDSTKIRTFLRYNDTKFSKTSSLERWTNFKSKDGTACQSGGMTVALVKVVE